MTRRRRRRSRQHGWSRRRLRSFGIGLTLAVVTFEVVYRLVALPLDYVPPERAAMHHEAVLPAVADNGPRAGMVPLAQQEAGAAAGGPAALAVSTPALAPIRAQLTGLRLAGRIERPLQRLALAVTPAPAAGPTAAAGPVDVAAAVVEPPGEPRLRRAPAPVLATLPTVGPPAALARRGTAPLVSIVIDDMGYSPPALDRLMAMPGPLSLSFLPNAESTPAMLERARRQPFELMLHLPMEPLGDADPGPDALLVGLAEDEIRRRLRLALRAVPEIVGVNNHMGSRFTADPRGLGLVMDELRQRPLFFLDSLTNPASLAEAAAAAAGIPTTRRDVFIDHVAEPLAIARQLRRVEQLGRRAGSVVAIGHPYPETLDALERWLPTLERKGFRLAPVTQVIALRRCGDATMPPGTCAPGIHLVGTGPGAFQPQGDSIAP